MNDVVRDLKTRLREITDLSSAIAVLSWDQMTYMPPGGAEARGRQIATLERIAHARKTDPKLGEIIGRLGTMPDAAAEHALVRVAKRRYDLARRVPTEFVSELAEHSAASYVAWTKARPANDFAAVRPHLERMVELSRRYADFFPGYDHPADPHIDASDEGMTAARVRPLFDELRRHLVPLVRAIGEKAPPKDDFMRGHFPIDAQIAVGKRIIEALGYDFERGRQDFTHHPFMTRFASGDVRITTRAREDELTDALFSTIHEAGHAMYEQGIDPGLDGTPLGEGVSAGVHESQSRLWENLVGRSRPFWQWALPILRETFPAALGSVDAEAFYRAINKVKPSLVRTDADEVTYNLHVMLRVELEMRLLEGTLTVKDLPEAWNAAYQTMLGLHAPDDRDGVLQDVHWYVAPIGGSFQGYTLGNLMSAQFFAAANRARPTLETEVAHGEFGGLRTWLTDNLYRHGATDTPLDLVTKATGKPLATDDFVAYLRQKFGALYGLSLS